MHVRRQLRLASALALLAAAARPGLALDARAPASRYRRTTFTTEDGLGSNVINDVLQTRDGFLWIADSQGLTRFDGEHFTQGPKLFGEVNSMAEGPDGDLWLATEAGVFRASPRFLEQPGDPRVTVYHLGSGGDDAVWSVLFGRDGTLWAGTRRGLYRWNGGPDFSPVVSGYGVYHIKEAPDGHILVPNSRGYMEWDGARSIDHPEVAQQLGIRPDQVFQVFHDRHGALWFSTGPGLFRQIDGSVTNIGGRGKAAYETYQDTSGNYWISVDGGVFRVRGNALEAVATDVQCRVLFVDRDGGLWIGTNGDGLFHIQDGPVHMFVTADGLRSHAVMAALATRSGKLWVATNCGGIAWFDGERFHPLPSRGLRLFAGGGRQRRSAGWDLWQWRISFARRSVDAVFERSRFAERYGPGNSQHPRWLFVDRDYAGTSAAARRSIADLHDRRRLVRHQCPLYFQRQRGRLLGLDRHGCQSACGRSLFPGDQPSVAGNTRRISGGSLRQIQGRCEPLRWRQGAGGFTTSRLSNYHDRRV